MIRNGLLILASLVALGWVFWAVSKLWISFGIELTMHGWIAYGLGCTFSIVLAVVLFHLTFKSSREGYDDIDRPEDQSK